MNNPSMHILARGFAAQYEANDFLVLASVGEFNSNKDVNGNTRIPPELIPEIQEVIRTQTSQYRKKWFFAFFQAGSDLKYIICIETERPMDPIALDLIQLFNMDVGIAFNNLYLNKEISDTQIELIYNLGEMIESRSKETGCHVYRVGQGVELLAEIAGLSEEEIKTIKNRFNYPRYW